MEVCEQDKVEYIPYSNLPVPADSQSPVDAQLTSLVSKFQSKDWKRHFDALTQLRALNKHTPHVFIEKLLPVLFKEVALQVDNLRSNNSKQALTLLTEILEHNKIATMPEQDLGVFVSKLFLKSCSEKGFLKTEAREGIAALEKAEHPRLVIEVSLQTQANNYQISELAIVTLKNCLLKKGISKENVASQEFLRILAKNIHGKRQLIEKTSKEILGILDKAYTAEGLTAIIQSAGLAQEDKDALTKQLANINKANSAPQKTKGSLKDFLKQKKESVQHDKMQVQ